MKPSSEQARINTNPAPEADAAPAPDFFAAHNLRREDLPPAVVATIVLLEELKAGGVAPTSIQFEQIETTLASLGDANHKLASAMRERISLSHKNPD